jgi:hypothetical protein
MTVNDPLLADEQTATATPETLPGMPLGARRLLLIGGLCIPAGLIGGSYLFGLQLLALAGVTLIAVALSYRPGRIWFSPVSWVTAAAGALWTAFTAVYYLAIIAAADASAPLPGYAPVLFNAGAAGVAVMAAAAGAGLVVRMVRASRLSARTS